MVAAWDESQDHYKGPQESFFRDMGFLYLDCGGCYMTIKLPTFIKLHAKSKYILLHANYASIKLERIDITMQRGKKYRGRIYSMCSNILVGYCYYLQSKVH